MLCPTLLTRSPSSIAGCLLLQDGNYNLAAVAAGWDLADGRGGLMPAMWHSGPPL